MRLTQIIESLLFASDAPLSAADLSRVDERLDEDTVEAVIEELRAEYELSERSFQIYEVGGGYQLLTRPEFVTVLERYDSVPQPSRLSAPALEVLAIIAYRQPLGRAEIEDIRGVGSSGVLRTLQERSLVEPVARGEGLGRPLLYGTTRKFLEHFGFRSLEDLPRPDELPVVLRDRTPIAALPLEDGDTSADGAAAEAAAAPTDAEAPAAGAAPAPADADIPAVDGDTLPDTADSADETASDVDEAAAETMSFDGVDAGEADDSPVTLDRPEATVEPDDEALADGFAAPGDLRSATAGAGESTPTGSEESATGDAESAASGDVELDEVSSQR